MKNKELGKNCKMNKPEIVTHVKRKRTKKLIESWLYWMVFLWEYKKEKEIGVCHWENYFDHHGKTGKVGLREDDMSTLILLNNANREKYLDVNLQYWPWSFLGFSI